jgi:hypothetical protein
VEIFDNNVSGGLIDDLVSVLLIRPEGGVRVDTDRGFDSDTNRTAAASQHALVAKLAFTVLANSPTQTTLNILAQGDDLTGLGPNANAAVVLQEGMSVDALANPAATDATITIQN